MQSLLGALCTLCFHPRRSGIRHFCDNHLNVKGSDKSGGKGMPPSGCLPLWGREGITLIAFPPEKKYISFFSGLTGDEP
jgi:hypothetical protein